MYLGVWRCPPMHWCPLVEIASLAWWRPCSAAAVDPRDGRPPAVLHKGFLLAGGQAPCDVHGRAIEGVAEWAVMACSVSQRPPGPRCWWLCPATWCAAGAEGSGGGIRWIAALVLHRSSTTRCHIGESTGHKLGRRTSWSFRSTGHFPTLACWVWLWQQLFWQSCSWSQHRVKSSLTRWSPSRWRCPQPPALCCRWWWLGGTQHLAPGCWSSWADR